MIRFTERHRGTRTAPEKIDIYQSQENRNSLPIRTSEPSEGMVGGTPTPRKLSVASVRIASDRLIVAMTSAGPITLGSLWVRMIRHGLTPVTLAASTHALPRSTRTSPRTLRAYWTQ